MNGTDYFASDVHLSADRPDVTARFLRFLDVVKREGAARLFLLGDIFDIWLGPKQVGLAYVVPVLARLRALTAAGIQVTYLAGNRDFNFDGSVNGGQPPEPLRDEMTVESGGVRLYLTHGDLLCTGDRNYRRTRRAARSGPVRWLANNLPLRFSIWLSRGFRRLSERELKRKPRLETAIDFSRVRGHLAPGHDAVICGHVHRAARYRVDLGCGRVGEFLTLGDWYGEGIYLVSEGGKLEFRRLP